jgi:glycine cleavage system H protein
MDGFSYVNIFDTKGIEYLVIIAFLLLLIPFWLLLNKKARVVKEIRKAYKVLTFNILKIRNGLFYSKFHTWTFLEKSGRAKVGLDDLLLNITGAVKIDFKRDHDEIIKKGELIAELKQDGKHLRVFSPISGQITSFNSELMEDTSVINEDPYGSGWICEIQPSAWRSETNSYFLAEEASEWFKQELVRFKDFLSVKSSKYADETSQVTMQDGGEVMNHILAELPEGYWADFQKEFLEPGEGLK